MEGKKGRSFLVCSHSPHCFPLTRPSYQQESHHAEPLCWMAFFFSPHFISTISSPCLAFSSTTTQVLKHRCAAAETHLQNGPLKVKAHIDFHTTCCRASSSLLLSCLAPCDGCNVCSFFHRCTEGLYLKFSIFHLKRYSLSRILGGCHDDPQRIVPI